MSTVNSNYNLTKLAWYKPWRSCALNESALETGIGFLNANFPLFQASQAHRRILYVNVRRFPDEPAHFQDLL